MKYTENKVYRKAQNKMVENPRCYVFFQAIPLNSLLRKKNKKIYNPLTHHQNFYYIHLHLHLLHQRQSLDKKQMKQHHSIKRKTKTATFLTTNPTKNTIIKVQRQLDTYQQTNLLSSTPFKSIKPWKPNSYV